MDDLNQPLNSPAPIPTAARRTRPNQVVEAVAVATMPRQRLTPRDLLVQAFYHRTLLIGCLVLGLVAGLGTAFLSGAQFTADALVLVFIGPESAAAQDTVSGNQTVVSIDGLKVMQSEVQIIQNDQIIREAVQQIGPTTLYPWVAAGRWFGLAAPRNANDQLGAAIQRFRDDLRVDSDAGSNVIRISFTHRNRSIAIQAVEAVLEGYLAQRREIYASGNSTFLDREIARYSGQLRDFENQIQALRTQYDVLDMSQDIVLAIDRLDGVNQRQNQVRERQVAVETELVAVQATLAKEPETVLDFKETSNNTGNDEARNTLVRLEQERTHLVSLYNNNWPGLRDLDAKIATVQAQISGTGQSLYFTNRIVRNPAIEMLSNRAAALEVESKALVQQLIELTAQARQAAQRITSLREADGKLHELLLTRDATESIYRQLMARRPNVVFQANIVDEHNSNLRVVQPASAPLIGRSMAVSYLVGGVLLGLLLGISVVAIATLLRQVYIAPGEAERDLGMPSLGELSGDPTSVITADGQGDIAELAAMVQELTIDGRPLSSLQIVSPADDGSRTSVIRALGVELAAGYDLRTLILDLQSDGHALARTLGQPTGTPSPVPTTSVPVAATAIPGLWVSIGAGSALFGDKRLSAIHARTVLDALRQQFGMLLVIAPIDASYLLLCRLAALVDANLLVVRAEQTRAPAAARLRDVIFSAGGNMLGFIFVGRRYYVPTWLYRWI